MSNIELNPKLVEFIEKNIELIENQQWDKIYKDAFDVPTGFTEAMLNAGINPLYQGLNYIPDYFLYHSSIQSFTIPDHIKSIGNNAFFQCSSLTNIEIPDTVTSIGYDAFYGCSSLASITIPGSITNIENYAFENCTKLKEINITQTVQQVEEILQPHIKKGWRYGSNIEKIICLDGVIDLE